MFDFIEMGFDNIKQAFGGLYQIGRGLKTVFAHTFREPTTQVYPDKMPELPAHFRGRLALTVNPETGENLCISCRQCERVCPDKCIEITAHKSTETNKLELIDFRIDHGLCMFCGLCTEVCPTYCIINTNDFEMADYSRESLIYDLKKLTLSQEESAYYFDRKEMPLPKPKPVKAAAAVTAAPTATTSKAAAPEAAGSSVPKTAVPKTANSASPDASSKAVPIDSTKPTPSNEVKVKVSTEIAKDETKTQVEPSSTIEASQKGEKKAEASNMETNPSTEPAGEVTKPTRGRPKKPATEPTNNEADANGETT